MHSIADLILCHPDSSTVPAGLGGRGSIRAQRHAWCSGLAGGCHLCAENLLAAAAAHQRFLFLCRQLGLSLSPGKGFPPAQQGEFTGLHLCTVTRVVTVTVPAAKLAGILECLRELLSADSAPRRAIARAQGKIVHYRCAIQYLCTVTPAFSPLTS